MYVCGFILKSLMIIRHLEKMFSASKRPKVDRKCSIVIAGEAWQSLIFATAKMISQLKIHALRLLQQQEIAAFAAMTAQFFCCHQCRFSKTRRIKTRMVS